MKNIKIVIISVAATLIVCFAAFMIWNSIADSKEESVDDRKAQVAKSVNDNSDVSNNEEGTISADGSEYICNHTYIEGDYILADSDIREVDKKELRELSDDELCLARNEIYARHGRKFNDNEIQNYFSSQSWYSGVIEPENFKEKVLSDIEIDNVEKILKEEQKRQKKDKKSKDHD